jgi:hypothetical protein
MIALSMMTSSDRFEIRKHLMAQSARQRRTIHPVRRADYSTFDQ